MALTWTAELLDQVRQRLASGETCNSIARDLGIHPGRIRDAFRRHSLGRPSDYSPGPVADRGFVAFGDRGAAAVPNRPQTPSLETLRDWLQQAADEEGVAPADVTRKAVLSHTPAKAEHFSAYGGFPAVRAHWFGKAADRDPDLAQRQNLFRNRNRIAELERQVGDRDYLAQQIRDAIAEQFRANPIRLTAPKLPPRPMPAPRLLTAAISDMHLGLCVDPREVPGSEFSWPTASRRLGKVAYQAATWKPDRHAETDLQLVLIGDILHGIIHADDQGQARLAEQIHGALQMFVPFLDYLLHHYLRVRLLCLPGNHERITVTRQLSQRWDHHGHAVYAGLECAFRTVTDRVTFDVPRSGDGTFELPGGELAYASHGDVCPLTGNPGGTVNTGRVEANFNALNASDRFQGKVRLWLAGHHHTAFQLHVGSGTVIVNGPFTSPDGYAKNAANVHGPGRPGQWLIESIPGYPCGDTRLVGLRDADGDPSYNEIVPVPDLDLSRVA